MHQCTGGIAMALLRASDDFSKHRRQICTLTKTSAICVAQNAPLHCPHRTAFPWATHCPQNCNSKIIEKLLREMLYCTAGIALRSLHRRIVCKTAVLTTLAYFVRETYHCTVGNALLSLWKRIADKTVVLENMVEPWR